MSVRNFWTIFLKVLGIWLVINGVTTIIQFVTSFFSVIAGNNNEAWTIIYYILLLIVTIGIYLFILWLFVFKTSWLIDKLQLERGFKEDRIEGDFDYSKVMMIATIVIGGYIFVDSLPMFCRYTFNYFQQKQMFQDGFSSGWLFFYLAKSVIGYLLMTNSRSVVKFIEKQFK
ncbi:hypothetical protein Palpr_0661 [Paludibacter propionicigenes WB4]|uniref:Transmembrane protein n=1 Tax=Paludibacter propionicigenes (strain DSM 17365 / JCM 13257 / WB4) TaxID=694427 RepID=E4T273_PALPW|nr:hypothetical protein [Paludibacter propionicigenes]ADQ78817.1 hypothetical protein Palpr_0661 [Paludibacter propionicigenes WB4]